MASKIRGKINKLQNQNTKLGITVLNQLVQRAISIHSSRYSFYVEIYIRKYTLRYSILTVNFEFHKKIMKKNVMRGLNCIKMLIRSYTAHLLQG